MRSPRCTGSLGKTNEISLKKWVNLRSLIEGGINHATRSLAIELATHNVQVNAVARAVIDTPLPPAVTIDPSRGLAPDDTRNVTQQIVDAVLYLTDSESMTGMVIPIAGGVTAEAWGAAPQGSVSSREGWHAGAGEGEARIRQNQSTDQ